MGVKIETEYNIGDTIYYLSIEPTMQKANCPVCKGEGRIDYINGEYVGICCPKCEGVGSTRKVISNHTVCGPYKVKHIRLDILEGQIDTSYSIHNEDTIGNIYLPVGTECYSDKTIAQVRADTLNHKEAE